MPTENNRHLPGSALILENHRVGCWVHVRMIYHGYLWVKSCQIMSNHVKSCQIMSNHVKLQCCTPKNDVRRSSKISFYKNIILCFVHQLKMIPKNMLTTVFFQKVRLWWPVFYNGAGFSNLSMDARVRAEAFAHRHDFGSPLAIVRDRCLQRNPRQEQRWNHTTRKEFSMGCIKIFDYS